MTALSPPHFKLSYQDPFRTVMEHVKSGEHVMTDAPLDNNGLGEAFSPTDLVSAALCSCVMTIMGIKAKSLGYPEIKMEARVWKKMASNPRRIASINIKLEVSITGVSEKHQQILERTTRACPVARSLHAEVQKNVMFSWDHSQTSTSA